MTNTEEIKRQLVEKYLEELGKKYGIWFEQQDKDDLEETLAGYLPSSALVRPLVWEDKVTFSWTKTILGPEQIYLNNDNTWVLHGHGGVYETREAAKEAVFSRYSALIGSCLQWGGYTREDIMKIRNRLYDLLPTGEVTAWDMIERVKSFLNEVDEKYLSSLKQQ